MAYRSHGRPRVSWWSGAVPPTGPLSTTNIWVGLTVYFSKPGRIFGFSAFRGASSSNAPFLLFWDSSGQLLCAKSFYDALTGAAAWQNAWIHPSIRIQTNHDYKLAIMFPGGGYSRTTGGLTGTGTDHNGIVFWRGFTSTSLAPEVLGTTDTANTNGIDVLFYPD